MKRISILSILLLILCAVSVEAAVTASTITLTPLTATEGTAYTAIASASDPAKPAATFNFVLTGLPSWIPYPAAVTGVTSVTLTGMPNSGTDASIIVTATDAADPTNTASNTFALSVDGKPVITSTPGPTVVAGQIYTYTIVATEPEGQAMTYLLITPPTGMTNAGNVVTWTPSETSTPGSVPVRVRVQSGALYTDQSFSISVTAPSAPKLVSQNITIGDSSQPRSNPDAEDNEDSDVRVSKTLTLTNNGGYTLTGFTSAISSPVYQSSQLFNITMTGLPTSLAPAASAQVTVQASIVEDLDAVDAALAEAAFKIADITFTATASNSQSVQSVSALSMQAENQLGISDISICVDDDCQSYDDGDKVESIKPGSKIDVKIIAENKYSDSDPEDIDIDDVEAKLDIDDADLRKSENEDIGTVSSDSEEEATLSFDIKDSAKDGTYKMIIEVFGDSESGAKMGEKKEISLEINRESHELTVASISLAPSELSCTEPQKTITLSSVVKNVGKKDEDAVALKISSETLKILPQTKKAISINKERKKTIDFTIQVPTGLKPGQYGILMETFYDDTEASNTKEVLLTVPKCGVFSEVEKAAAEQAAAEEAAKLKLQQENIEVKNEGTNTPVSGESATTSTLPDTSAGTTSSSLKNVGYIAILAGAAIVLVLIGVILIAALVRRS